MIVTLAALAGIALAAHSDLEDPSAADLPQAPVAVEALAARASEGSPRLRRLEEAREALAARERARGRPLAMRREGLIERYTLAAGASGDPFARARLGWLMFEVDPERATFYWMALLEEQPEGPHAQWSELGLGDAARLRGDLRDASAHYSAVVDLGSDLAPLAAYRRAEVSFRQSSPKEAAADLVLASRRGEGELRERARAQLVWSVVGEEPQSARSWFEAACGEATCVGELMERWGAQREELQIDPAR